MLIQTIVSINIKRPLASLIINFMQKNKNLKVSTKSFSV